MAVRLSHHTGSKNIRKIEYGVNVAQDSRQCQLRSDGGAGRTGRHLLGAAKGRKTPKCKKINFTWKCTLFFLHANTCLRARKTKRHDQRVPIVGYYVGSLAASGSNLDLLTLRETYALNRLYSFKNLRRKGGKLITALGGQRSCYATGQCADF